MIKNKSIDYIFGMITGASLMLTFFVCTQAPLRVSGSTVQEVKEVIAGWAPWGEACMLGVLIKSNTHSE